jgi:hypothetical protein
MKNCTDCLTKTDVKKFFSNLLGGTAFFVAMFFGSVGFITSLGTVADWMEKPSETQKLEQKVDDLEHQHTVIYDEPRWDVEAVKTTHEDDANH